MGAREWIIILVIVVLLFGAPKLPELARSVGKSLNILKDETSNLRSDKDAKPADQAAGATTAAATPEAPQQTQAPSASAIPDSTVELPSDDEARGK
ncbi:Sec-independent protein translocase subunit TatA [Demequina sp. NBRC 110057]|uniref:Sec-independent protein translocase subunit TatA n=1 Tax=Demequina sp. NBRC 110057 TaxID=1570346 RepID=UPI000A01D794|nr:Sec-independent protein translocase subunit TatA [Demequina sp. NBRC 110057]